MTALRKGAVTAPEPILQRRDRELAEYFEVNAVHPRWRARRDARRSWARCAALVDRGSRRPRARDHRRRVRAAGEDPTRTGRVAHRRVRRHERRDCDHRGPRGARLPHDHRAAGDRDLRARRQGLDAHAHGGQGRSRRASAVRADHLRRALRTRGARRGTESGGLADPAVQRPRRRRRRDARRVRDGADRRSAAVSAEEAVLHDARESTA